MAREKGTGSLQREKSGRWTIRVGINGRRLSRSTGTTDKDKAERILERFLAPFGLGAHRLPLANVWNHYEMSPRRKDLAKSTLNAKRVAWMRFARWIEENHIEITDLAQVTPDAIAEYLAQYRCHHSASTYNGHVCVLREVFRLLADKAGLAYDPWYGVCLLSDDSLSRRELTLDEIERLYMAAGKQGAEWKLLVMTGIYTGLRLGDCCRLKWESVNLERGVIQVIPEKTKKHAHGRPVTIPIHPMLLTELQRLREEETWDREESSRSPFLVSRSQYSDYVNPKIAEAHMTTRWRVDEGLRKIFNAAEITMSVHVEGRQRKHVLASFHSLRHTFVSLSANAGVSLAVVQSIVGHSSSAMTRHYYHENEAVLRQAVEAIPAIGEKGGAGWRRMSDGKETGGSRSRATASSSSSASITKRLRRLDRMFDKGLLTEDEFKFHRARILSEM